MKPKALLTTIPSDSHNWNLIYMHLLLEENGFEVNNLGPCTSFRTVEQACTETSPDVVIVSTVNGHGYLEGQKLIEVIRKMPHMKDIPVYLGGKLSTDKNMAYICALELEAAGYAKVYYENGKAASFISGIRKSIEKAI